MSPSRSIGATLLRGFAVVLPIVVLVASVWWLVRTAEALAGPIIRPFFPHAAYVPGMGLATAVVACYIVGVFINTRPALGLISLWHRLLDRIPLVKSLYGAVEDILASMSQGKDKRFDRVVKVKLPALDMWLVGFVTREDLSALPPGLDSSEEMAVYLPMSYQIGGYLIFVPRSSVEPLHMSVEDASRLVLTAGMSVRKSKPAPRSE
jgi:uncharacterized membrane protein